MSRNYLTYILYTIFKHRVPVLQFIKSANFVITKSFSKVREYSSLSNDILIT